MVVFFCLKSLLRVRRGTTGTSQTYTVTDLGTFPGGTYSTALAIDEAGQVTGWSSGTYGPGGEAYSYAFIYRDGKLLNLGALAATAA